MKSWRIECLSDLFCQKVYHRGLNQDYREQEQFKLWGLVPVLTDVAGLYLGTHDWELLNFEIAAFNLPQLLLKPGLADLHAISSLSSYAAWNGLCVLNARFMTHMNRRQLENSYQFQSPFDGSRILLDECICNEVLGQLTPDLLIMPDIAWQIEPAIASIHPWWQSSDSLADTRIGTLLPCDEQGVLKQSMDEISAQCRQNPQKIYYVAGDYDLQEILLLLLSGVDLVETSRVAQDAVDGLLYTRDGIIQLGDKQYEHDFRPVEEDCPCSTCQHFTRAYLHHLHTQTPLLSKRLQIVHNLHFARFLIEKLLHHSKQGKLREFINNYMI